MRKLFVLLLLCPFLLSCGSRVEKKSEPAEQEQVQEEESPSYDSSQEPRKYRPPDGGFGTLDDAKDARRATHEQESESEQALKDTE